MVAYSFKQQFIEPILCGAKRQTIRALRGGKSWHAAPGDELQLYTAMRTKYCRLIGKAICTEVWPVTIDFRNNVVTVREAVHRGEVSLDFFAQGDGFGDWLGMREFWAREHQDTPVFSGVLIRWDSFRAG